MYTQHDFKLDLAFIKDAADAGGDAAALSNAIARGRTLLSAGGQVGSVVVGGNRADLERAVSRCQSIMDSGGPPLPKPADGGGNDGDVDAGGVN